MNKYLLMSAAALLAGTSSAHAGVHSFTFGTSNGGSYCDGGTIVTGLGGGDVATWIHTNNNCSGGTSIGAGLLIKVKGLGKVYVLSDNFEAKNYGVYNEYLSYTINKKLTQWTLWVGFSGISNFEGNTGPLNNVTAGAHGGKGRGTTSTAAKLAALLEAHHV